MPDERVGEIVDGIVARPLHPLRQIRIFIEGNRVHLRTQAANEPRQRDGVLLRVVVA